MAFEYCVRRPDRVLNSDPQANDHVPKKDHSHMEQEIAVLVTKGVIVQVTESLQKGFLSPIFLVPKKDCKMRPVINLRDLKSFITTTHFKMEVIHMVRYQMLQSDWITCTDLKVTYLQCPYTRITNDFCVTATLLTPVWPRQPGTQLCCHC